MCLAQRGAEVHGQLPAWQSAPWHLPWSCRATCFSGNAVTNADQVTALCCFRHLWAFSLLHSLREPTAEVHALCDSLYSFLLAHFRDPQDNLYYQAVSQDGSNVTQRVKPLYAEVFAMQGLAQYAQAFGNRSTLDAAMLAFRMLDSLYHIDGVSGWSEVLDTEGWTPAL